MEVNGIKNIYNYNNKSIEKLKMNGKENVVSETWFYYSYL